MKKILLSVALLSSFAFAHAQKGRWYDLFSYNNVKVLADADDKIIAATENGIFYYTPSSGEITKLSKATGLHEVKITAFAYDKASKTMIVGYRSGNMDIVTENGIYYIVDIPMANQIVKKAIKHISVEDGVAVITVENGISLFDIKKREFNDTALFSFVINEAVKRGNTVYAATANGIIKHATDTSFPVSSTWTTVQSGNFTQITSGSVLAAATADRVVYGDNFATLSGSFTDVKDVSADKDILVIDGKAVYRYSLQGSLISQTNTDHTLNSALVKNGRLYAASELAGVITPENKSIKPDGPYNNKAYKLSLLKDEIWVATGGRTNGYNQPVSTNLGYFHFNGTEWKYPQLFLDSPAQFNVLDVVPNPENTSEVYFTNYKTDGTQGIYKMQNNVFVKKFEPQNNGSNSYFRPVGLAFKDGALLASIAYLPLDSQAGLYVLNKGAQDFSPVTKYSALVGAVQKPIVGSNVLWVPDPREGMGGLAAHLYNGSIAGLANAPVRYLTTQNNLPVDAAVAVAQDNSGDLWIGAGRGLRVLRNAEQSIRENNPTTEAIVIVQNNIPEELFKDTSILSIAVDAGNQKWVSTEKGGVFYLSADGQRTIHRFTAKNSPLPADEVYDIQIDKRNGKVYFATDDGIVVYQGDVANIGQDFGSVLVYPNPVITAQYRGNVTIRGLAERTHIRITDSAGNLVHQATANGGFYEWDLNNLRGSRVASGIYFVLMSNNDGTATKTAKIAVVN
ncbi:MAG: T9SS C-terminal target domain-containing protein [Chryseobacterium sp.]|nr:MAG: T9SS C-terminal target domain-containing protein [Chryseobacterium sp.]